MKWLGLLLALLASPALAQGGMGPGPGTVHSTGGGAIWTLKSNTQMTSGGINGGTTSAIDCTGANLILMMVSSYAVGANPSITDSSSNTWSAVLGPSAPGGGNLSLITAFLLVNPTVSAAQTFTLSATGGYPTMAVHCWIDSSGTPAFDSGATNNGTASPVTTLSPGTYLPTVPNALVITWMTSYGTVTTYTVDSGFTVSDQIPNSGSTHTGEGVAYLIQTTATSKTPIWTATPTETFGASAAMFGVKP